MILAIVGVSMPHFWLGLLLLFLFALTLQWLPVAGGGWNFFYTEGRARHRAVVEASPARVRRLTSRTVPQVERSLKVNAEHK